MNRKWTFYAGYGLAFFGALLALIGFFLPWIVLQPSKLALSVGDLFGDFGGLLTGGLESIRLQVSGAHLAVGITFKQLIKMTGDLGETFLMFAGDDPSMSERLVPPLVWLFLFPLSSLVGWGLMIWDGVRGKPRQAVAVTVIGVVVFVFLALHVLAISIGWHTLLKQIAEDPDMGFLVTPEGALITLKLGSGIWLLIFGSFFWMAGGGLAWWGKREEALAAPAPTPRETNILPRRSGAAAPQRPVVAAVPEPMPPQRVDRAPSPDTPTQIDAPAARSLPPAMLEIVRGPEGVRPQRWRIPSDNVLIGRSRACDLQILDPMVSRQHARLRYAQGAWFIQDQGSKAGIYVNGKRVLATRLNPGDTIKLGRTLLRFHAPLGER